MSRTAERGVAVRRVGVVLVAVVVALGTMTSCTGKKHASKANRKPSSSAGRTPAGTPSPRRLNAADYLLTAGPATAGLTAESGQGDDDSSLTYALRGPVGQCLGVSAGDLGAAATDQQVGSRFVRTGTDPTTGRAFQLSAVSSSAAVYANARTVSTQRDIVRRERFASCYARMVVAEINEPGASVVSSRVARPPAGASDRVSAVIGGVSQGRDVRFYVDFVLFFRGRVESSVTVAQGSRPATDAQLAGLSNALYSKITRQ